MNKFFKELHIECVDWIKGWFDKNGKECNAVIGMSGGKDSTIAAYLCAEALGKDRVIGLIMPNGVQADYDDAVLACNSIGIKYKTINISNIFDDYIDALTGLYEVAPTERTTQNLPPRIRMTLLYALAQSVNGRVCNTCNLSERSIGWETLWGDSVGDFSPFGCLTATEVVNIGDTCNLPELLVHKAPADGLCGATDEDKFGFTYEDLDFYLDGFFDEDFHKKLSDETIENIKTKMMNSLFKRQMCVIPSYHISEKLAVKYDTN